METSTKQEKLGKVNYFKKRHRLIGLLNYIYCGAGTLCTILFTSLPDWLKIIVGAVYFILVFSAVVSTINRGYLNFYLDNAEEFYDYGIKNGLQMDNISRYLELIKRLHLAGGIADIQKDNANYFEIVEHITEAKSSIKIIVYFGDRLLLQTKNFLINAINGGVDVELLIAKRDSDLLKEVWKLEGHEKYNRWEEAQNVIDEIKAKTEGGSGTFTYRPYNTQARYAIIIVDNEWAWWTPYHSGIDVGETTSFILIDKGEKSIIRQCKTHFTKLWLSLEQEQNKLNVEVQQ